MRTLQNTTAERTMLEPSMSIRLVTGDLEVFVSRAEIPLEDLCGFAARRNPKRGFLFISKVLGRHLPVRPSVIRNTHRRLAAKIPSDLPGPVVVVGLAETAICLGQGIHEEYQTRTGREDLLFIHTTRTPIHHPVAFSFFEEHSHATRHLVYRPEAQRDQHLFANARSLVLVDDEATTGRTLVNLARAFTLCVRSIEQVLCLMLTDWRGSERAESSNQEMPRPCSWESLLEGEYRFSPSGMPCDALGPFEIPPSKDQRPRRNDGRLGLSRPPTLATGTVASLALSSGERVLVLGSGEFCFLPFLLAERIEELGCEVRCQATTRSPALMGHAIGRREVFWDPDAYGAPMFLYNVTPGDYDHIFFCCDRSPCAVSPALLANLGALAIEL